MTRGCAWPVCVASPARRRRLTAIALVSDMFPKPHNYASYLGFNLRKARLEMELAEYDFLHRQLRGRPAGQEELTCAGELLVSSCKERFPVSRLPLEEDLLVNPATFDRLAGQVETMMKGSDPA